MLLILSIILVTTLCSCSSTEVDFVDLKLKYDAAEKTYTIENFDERDLYGITVHVHEITPNGNHECVDQKIASLFVGESTTFSVQAQDTNSVNLENATANTDPEWEEKNNKAWNNVFYIFLGIVGFFILALVVYLITCWFIS